MAFASVGLIAGCLSGCTSVDSANIKTAGIKPAMSIVSTPDAAGSKVDVSLHVGDSPTTFVALQSTETLTASAGDAPVTLTEQNALGVTSYTGTLATKTPGTVVTIALTRPDDTSAPASTVTMTEQLTLTSPAPGDTASRAGDDVEVAWTDSAASQDGVHVSWSGDCVDDGSVDVAAGETHATIKAGTLQKKSGNDIADTCDVIFSAARSRAGTVDPAFGGGSIVHTFVASAKITSSP